MGYCLDFGKKKKEWKTEVLSCSTHPHCAKAWCSTMTMRTHITKLFPWVNKVAQIIGCKSPCVQHLEGTGCFARALQKGFSTEEWWDSTNQSAVLSCRETSSTSCFHLTQFSPAHSPPYASLCRNSRFLSSLLLLTSFVSDFLSFSVQLCLSLNPFGFLIRFQLLGWATPSPVLLHCLP